MEKNTLYAYNKAGVAAPILDKQTCKQKHNCRYRDGNVRAKMIKILGVKLYDLVFVNSFGCDTRSTANSRKMDQILKIVVLKMTLSRQWRDNTQNERK